jgi:hypothetical protein
LAQSFKEIKTKGVAVIQKMSADIAAKAQKVGDDESKQEFIDACESLKDVPQVCPFDSIHNTPFTVPSSDRIQNHCIGGCKIRGVSQKGIGGDLEGHAQNRRDPRVKSVRILES